MTTTPEDYARWHGSPGGYNNHKCRCAPCREAMRQYKKRYLARRGTGQQTKYVVRHKRKGGHGNRGKQWTGAELEFITSRGTDGKYVRSALEAANHLGRTVLAVERARNKCLHDPQYIAHVGAVLP